MNEACFWISWGNVITSVITSRTLYAHLHYPPKIFKDRISHSRTSLHSHAISSLWLFICIWFQEKVPKQPSNIPVYFLYDSLQVKKGAFGRNLSLLNGISLPIEMEESSDSALALESVLSSVLPERERVPLVYLWNGGECLQ